MVLPINIIAALVTVLSRGITRQLGLPPPAAVENGSPNIYQVFGFIAIVITGIYYLLRCISNPQATRKSIRNHDMSSDQSLGESSLAGSRTIMDPHISACIPKELPLRISSQESEISFPKRHPPRHETEEAKLSTSGISNLKRPYILEENYPPPKLRNVDDRFQHEHLHHDHLHHDTRLKTDRSPNPELVHPETATLKINDEPTVEPSSECYLEEGGDSPQNTPSKHRGPAGPREKSPENHRINHNIDLTTELVGDNTSQPEEEHMIRTTRSGKMYYGSKEREKRGYKRNK